jgi:hypothetical protein
MRSSIGYSNTWRARMGKKRKNLTPEERRKIAKELREVRAELRELVAFLQRKLDARRA